jgi:hypothetical protein
MNLMPKAEPMTKEQQALYDAIEYLDGRGLVISDYDLLVEEIQGYV